MNILKNDRAALKGQLQLETLVKTGILFSSFQQREDSYTEARLGFLRSRMPKGKGTRKLKAVSRK